jgi:Putative adhesin
MLRALLQVSLAGALLNTALLADDWSKKFVVSGRPELRVDANDGSVTIRTWDRKEIEARVTTVGWRIAPGEVTVAGQQTGDRIEIEVRIPHRAFSVNFGMNHRTVRVELQVPREIRSDIHTGDGAITVDGLHGETRLSTGDGHIEADRLDGTLDAQTGDGRLRIRGRFDMLNLHTGDGSIEAEIESGSKMSSEWRVRTGDGHVTLRLPSSFSAELDVHTGDGHIQSDLPVTVSGLRHDNELRGKLNAGGPPLVVRTNDGSIRLERL